MFKPGAIVGGGRWPNQKAHPEHWSKPIAGQVLDFCDSRAWANSIHFPVDNPHPGEVMGVALRFQAEGRISGLTPVLWDFGSHQRVHWERNEVLRSYDEELSLWRAAKALRLDEIEHPRRRKQRQLSEFLPSEMQHLAPRQLPLSGIRPN